MRKLGVLMFFLGVLMVGMSGLANAVSFDFGTNGSNNTNGNTNHWTLGTGWGSGSDELLNVAFSVNSLLPGLTFDLVNVGESRTFIFGRGTLNEDEITGGYQENETNNLSIAAYLYFVLPPVGGEGISGLGTALTGDIVDARNGYTYSHYHNWSYHSHTVAPVPEANDLTIVFTPITVAFAGGTFTVGIDPVSFDVNETLDFNATISLTSLTVADVPEPASVPEPATMLLLGSGLLGMGFFGRRRFKK